MKGICKAILIAQAFILACIYAITFYFSPLYGEDYGLTKRFVNDSFFQRFSWAFSKSISQIEGWNARLGEQLAIFSLSMPGYVFFIIAVLCVALLCYVISTLLYDVDNKMHAFVISIIITFLLWPGFELFFWRTVIAGYTLPMLITLFVAREFMNDKRRTSLIESKKKLAYYSVLGFLSGLSFENVPIAILFFLLVILLLNKKLVSRLSVIPVAIFSGWVLLITAPSTTYRREKYHEWFLNGLSPIDQIEKRSLDVITVFSNTSMMLFVAAIAAFAYLAYKKKIFKEQGVLLISSILVVGSMVVSPYTEARSFMFAWCVMLAFVVAAIRESMTSVPKISLLVCILGMMAIFVSFKTYQVNKKYHDVMKIRSDSIESQLSSPNCLNGIKVDLVDGFKDYRYLNNRDEWFYNNLRQVSLYYGCKIVQSH
ncbi:hypothetical protein CBW58_23420 [Yersinia frederiksenii]|nr:hypothetical protein CBW58_23420 [Yersinia frederiksenii]